MWKKFKYPSQLTKHSTKKLSCITRSTKCENCNTTFSNFSSLTRHYVKGACDRNTNSKIKLQIAIKKREIELKNEEIKKLEENLI
jgi:hypothetical protein